MSSCCFTIDLYRVGDIVCPTYGLLLGHEGTVASIKQYQGIGIVIVNFGIAVCKYANRNPKLEWEYLPQNLRFISFGTPARRRSA